MNAINYFLTLTVVLLSFFSACNNPSENNEEETITSEKSVIDASKVLAVDYKIDGMTCKMGCAKTIEKTVAGLNGVVLSTVDFDVEKGHFEFDASIISEKESVADQYKVEEWKEEKDTSKEKAPSETKTEDKSVTNVKMPTFEIPNIFELLINQL